VKALRFLLPLAVLALLLAGCGGGSSPKVSNDDVAVVGSTHITQADFNELLAVQKASMKSSGQTVPTAGSTEYAQMRTNIINVLVQQAELAQEAKKLGLTITEAEVDKKLADIKKTSFGGSDAKYKAELKKEGFTDAQIRENLREKLLEQKIFDHVTKGAAATKSDIDAYYAANLTQFQKPATRDVDEILVGKNKQALANQIYQQLKSGADFAALAKKYSQDPGSKDKGGQFTATKGQDVPNFDAAVFDPKNKTGVLIKPVKTPEYGWFVIKPVAEIKPAATTPEKDAISQIRTQLQQQKQQQLASDWMQKVTKSYCSGHVSYANGFEPSPDPCAAIKAPNQTTT
jgi:parvulin-like peptidyl-prolyl isomerase